MTGFRYDWPESMRWILAEKKMIILGILVSSIIILWIILVWIVRPVLNWSYGPQEGSWAGLFLQILDSLFFILNIKKKALTKQKLKSLKRIVDKCACKTCIFIIYLGQYSTFFDSCVPEVIPGFRILTQLYAPHCDTKSYFVWNGFMKNLFVPNSCHTSNLCPPDNHRLREEKICPWTYLTYIVQYFRSK